MKKWIASLVVVMMTVMMLGGCASQKEASESSQIMEDSGADSTTAEGSVSVESGSAAESSAVEESSVVKEEPAAEKEDIRIAVLKGPTALGMLQIMEEGEAGTGVDNYDVTLAGSADEILGDIIQGNYDIAAVPTNVAAVLYNKTEGKVQLGALNTLGVLYMVSDDANVKEVSDLAGRTIYTLGQGSTPQYALEYILRRNGLDPETDVDICYKSEATEVAQLLSTGEAHLAMLPQPFVTSVVAQNESVSVVMDMTKEWNKVGDGSELTMGCIVVQKTFAEEHPEALMRFMEAYKASVAFTNEQPVEAAKLSEKFDVFKAAVAEKAIPACNIVFLSGDEAKTAAEGFLKVLFEADPKAVGGALPGEDFYLNITIK